MTEREPTLSELVEIYDAATSVIFDARRVAVDAAAVRAQVIRKLRRRGYTGSQLGDMLRISEQRVYQLLSKTRGNER